MSAAVQIYYSPFDAAFFKLPAEIQRRIEARIDEMGLRLAKFPHHRLAGSHRCRLRVGDYRVIYGVDLERCIIHLFAVGHRREIYGEPRFRGRAYETHHQIAVHHRNLKLAATDFVAEAARPQLEFVRAEPVNTFGRLRDDPRISRSAIEAGNLTRVG